MIVPLVSLLLWSGIAWSPDLNPNVMFTDIPHRGVACSPAFLGWEGNAQHLCPSGYEGILIHRDIGWDELAHVLFHENLHMEVGPSGPPHDPFHEIEIERLSCLKFPVEGC